MDRHAVQEDGKHGGRGRHALQKTVAKRSVSGGSMSTATVPHARKQSPRRSGTTRPPERREARRHDGHSISQSTRRRNPVWAAGPRSRSTMLSCRMASPSSLKTGSRASSKRSRISSVRASVG